MLSSIFMSYFIFKRTQTTVLLRETDLTSSPAHNVDQSMADIVQRRRIAKKATYEVSQTTTRAKPIAGRGLRRTFHTKRACDRTWRVQCRFPPVFHAASGCNSRTMCCISAVSRLTEITNKINAPAITSVTHTDAEWGKGGG
jgi:hypothetical protein